MKLKITLMLVTVGLTFSGDGKAQTVTDQTQPIIQKYVTEWQRQNPNTPLWVLVARPGDPLNIPGASANFAQDKAGMEMVIHAHLIILNKNMVPESVLSTFAHEYGHAQYRLAHPTNFNMVDSEVAAIRSSLTILPREGFESVAYREAKAIKEMADKEPYRSALQRLANDPLWKKYAGVQ